MGQKSQLVRGRKLGLLALYQSHDQSAVKLPAKNHDV